MSNCKIIDTWKDFCTFWRIAHGENVDEQIKLWQTSYMQKHPELLNKQAECYEEDHVDWRQIAKKLIPPFQTNFKKMRKARDNILQLYEPIYAKASERLKLDFSICFVIYVGIGCGAGWATTYNRQPALLLGLENIAEENWHKKAKLKGLMCHEIGHLAHMKWRDELENFEEAEQDPLFRLHSEGFAQTCEHLILGKETWHMAPNRDWLFWCKRNRDWLAREFLKRLKKHVSVNDFFGSWFNIQGKSQTGYFLGHELVAELEKTRTLREIAVLDKSSIKNLGLKCLNAFSRDGFG